MEKVIQEFAPNELDDFYQSNINNGELMLNVAGGTGLASAKLAGYSLKVMRYQHGGGGLNIYKQGATKFGVDLHHNNIDRVRLHFHRGLKAK